MKLKNGFVLSEVVGETVVLPSGDDLNLNMMITLNETGKFLWERLDKGASADELVSALLSAPPSAITSSSPSPASAPTR